jgi:hypothetical protein
MVMQRATHPSPIAIVSDHVEAWRRDHRWSRETVADKFVEAHERLEGPAITGIRFEPPTTDTFERMRVNADKIFRWLDDRSKDKNLMTVNFLWAVLAAMPMDRRVLLVNDLMQPVNLHVAGTVDGESDVSAAEIVEVFQAIVDHGAQANIAASQLLDGVHAGEAEHAEKKLGLMAATVNRARSLMARLMKRRKS